LDRNYYLPLLVNNIHNFHMKFIHYIQQYNHHYVQIQNIHY